MATEDNLCPHTQQCLTPDHVARIDAEIVAIQKTLNTVYQGMEDSTIEPSDVVIFSDCLSFLETIENWKNKPSKLIEKLGNLNNNNTCFDMLIE